MTARHKAGTRAGHAPPKNSSKDDWEALIEDIDWETLSWLVGIPPGERDAFSQWALIFVSNAWVRASEQPAGRVPNAPAADAKVAKATRSLIRALKERNAPADGRTAEMLSQFLRDNVASPRRGAPSKRAESFRRFVKALVGAVCAFGGRPSVNRRTGAGNIATLLNDLRPFLPPGFIPEALPLSFLEKVCTALRAEIAVLADDPISAADLRRPPFYNPPQ